MSRAVFAWEGVVESDKQILESHQIDTIFMDLNHYSTVPGYNIYLLAGDPSWGLEDMEKVVEEAKEKKADGLIFDIEGNYEALASNLSLLDSSLPIYVCIPFWLEEDVQEEIMPCPQIPEIHILSENTLFKKRAAIVERIQSKQKNAPPEGYSAIMEMIHGDMEDAILIRQKYITSPEIVSQVCSPHSVQDIKSQVSQLYRIFASLLRAVCSSEASED